MELTQDHILAQLAELRQEIERNYNVTIFGLFGSRARGTEQPRSDVDIAFKWREEKGTLFDLGGIWSDFHGKFGVLISLVDWDYARPSFKERLSEDLIEFYG